MTSASKAETIVRAFLNAMEARDLEKAHSYLAPGFKMVFPGNVQFSTLAELVEWSKERYRSVAKSYERFDACVSDGAEIVYCYGTLNGVWLTGEAFSDIRFIDRFVLVNGEIANQKVWNDMEIYRLQ